VCSVMVGKSEGNKPLGDFDDYRRMTLKLTRKDLGSRMWMSLM
jgi:hypothetical protein